MRVYGGCGSINPLALNLGCRRWWTVRLHSRLLYSSPSPSEEKSTATEYETGWLGGSGSQSHGTRTPDCSDSNLVATLTELSGLPEKQLRQLKNGNLPKASYQCCLCVALCRRGSALSAATICRIEAYSYGWITAFTTHILFVRPIQYYYSIYVRVFQVSFSFRSFLHHQNRVCISLPLHTCHVHHCSHPHSI